MNAIRVGRLPRLPRVPGAGRPVRRLPIVGGVAAGAVLLFAGPAFAHVTVQPGDAEKGGYSTIAFKVPNERDNASTVRLEVTVPTDHPLASVMPQPVPGWDVKVTKSKLAKPVELHGEKLTEAVSKVTWTGGKIEPGTFQQFPLSVGQLPEDVDQLVFKALQTYSNKEVVRWIQIPEEGQPEPENPAPVLKLVAPKDDAADSGDDAAAKGSAADGAKDAAGDRTETVASDTDDKGDGTDTTARVLGIVGIVVGVAGVAFGVLAGRRRTA